MIDDIGAHVLLIPDIRVLLFYVCHEGLSNGYSVLMLDFRYCVDCNTCLDIVLVMILYGV